MHTPTGTQLKRATFIVAITLLLPTFLISAPARAQSSEPSRNIAAKEVSGRFLDQWLAPGNDRDSLLLNGLPLTPQRPEISLVDGKTYTTQWFERARYELHPDNPPPYDIQLALLGTFVAEGRTKLDPSTGTPIDAADTPFIGINQPAELSATKLWFPETRHSLTGDFLAFWQQYGGLDQFGFPLSEPFAEPSPTDGKTYTVQYFERNRMELHPELPPPYNVQLGLLGSQLHRLTAIPAADLPIALPPGITSAKDTYTEGSLQEPDTLFCNEANTSVATRFCQAITFNDNIIGTDNLGNPFPLAAWYVPTFENGGTYYVGTGEDRHLVTKFKLRPGIKWSDGVELTSNDAIFSYQLLLYPYSVGGQLRMKLSSADNPDKYTVIYNWMSPKEARTKLSDPSIIPFQYSFLKIFDTLSKPVFDANYLAIGTVHPRHVLETIPPDKIAQSIQSQRPVGYGPYIVEDWQKGDHLSLVVNPNYNLTNKPLIKRIVVQFTSWRDWQIDGFTPSPRKYPNTEPVPVDGIAENWNALPEWTTSFRSAGGNVSSVPGDSLEYLTLQYFYAPFKDIRVRWAIAHAIDRTKLIDVAYQGTAKLINGPVPSSIFHSLENPNFRSRFPEIAAKHHLPIYDFDPATANRLLDEAGWIAPCGDPSKCTRQIDQQSLTFTYATTRSLSRIKIQDSVSTDLGRIGIATRVLTCNPSFWSCLDSLDLAEMLETNSIPTQAGDFSTWIQNLYERYKYYDYNPNLKVILANDLFNTSVSSAEIAEQSALIQTELLNDAFIVPLAQRPNVEAYSGRLRNRKTPNSNASTSWWNINQWYIVPYQSTSRN